MSKPSLSSRIRLTAGSTSSSEATSTPRDRSWWASGGTQGARTERSHRVADSTVPLAHLMTWENSWSRLTESNRRPIHYE